jgi:putative intracellular protease/amidase
MLGHAIPVVTVSSVGLILMRFEVTTAAFSTDAYTKTSSRGHRVPDGTWALKDRQLTGFSNEEETQAGFAGNAPWLLEDRLRISGARYIAKAPWTPHAIADGNLITGQQNYSAGVTADVVLKQLAATV